jgi:hypothetical protein
LNLRCQQAPRLSIREQSGQRGAAYALAKADTALAAHFFLDAHCDRKDRLIAGLAFNDCDIREWKPPDFIASSGRMPGFAENSTESGSYSDSRL